MSNSEKYRKLRVWVYGVALSAGPLVTFYGLMDSNEYALWMGLGATILGTPIGTTAIANINPPEETTVVVLEETDITEE